MKTKQLVRFKKLIWDFYLSNKREFPWRGTTHPYKILVSELMLQQTQADRVVTKYQSFIRRFPDFSSLATASLVDILKVWQGLGYNRRAMYLSRIAKIVIKKYQSICPSTKNELIKLPGIGPHTAGAIIAFAYSKPVVFIETNIRSVFIHFFFRKEKHVIDKDIIPLVEASLDRRNPREWYYALMDYGAHLKKTMQNPSRKSASYKRQSLFKTSNRYVRGTILKILLHHHVLTKDALVQNCIEREIRPERVETSLSQLETEGFIQQDKTTIRLTSSIE